MSRFFMVQCVYTHFIDCIIDTTRLFKCAACLLLLQLAKQAWSEHCCDCM